MAFCSKCGKEIMDEAVICPGCGCPVAGKATTYSQKRDVLVDDKVKGVLVAVSILIPIAGIIGGIVNLCKKKSKSGAIYLIVGIVATIAYSILIPFLEWY